MAFGNSNNSVTEYLDRYNRPVEDGVPGKLIYSERFARRWAQGRGEMLALEPHEQGQTPFILADPGENVTEWAAQPTEEELRSYAVQETPAYRELWTEYVRLQGERATSNLWAGEVTLPVQSREHHGRVAATFQRQLEEVVVKLRELDPTFE